MYPLSSTQVVLKSRISWCFGTIGRIGTDRGLRTIHCRKYLQRHHLLCLRFCLPSNSTSPCTSTSPIDPASALRVHYQLPFSSMGSPKGCLPRECAGVPIAHWIVVDVKCYGNFCDLESPASDYPANYLTTKVSLLPSETLAHTALPALLSSKLSSPLSLS